LVIKPFYSTIGHDNILLSFFIQNLKSGGYFI